MDFPTLSRRPRIVATHTSGVAFVPSVVMRDFAISGPPMATFVVTVAVPQSNRDYISPGGYIVNG
jgi:hypothetical protein